MRGGLSAIGWSDEAQTLDHGTPPLRITMDSQQLDDRPARHRPAQAGQG
ncbi:hypothetical protein ACWDBO_25755 [Streptomyces mirabilis]|jgi:hypothetical protein|nr:hypothetical protein [Streptomyces sp. AK02-04a]MDX3763456.1 hypothetical protein [Streptomyces sp. AK02-04a]